MVEGRSSARLALETLQRMPIDSGIFRKELQCDQAAQTNVFGLIDHSHTARAQLFLNAIVRDSLLVHDAQNSTLGRWHEWYSVCEDGCNTTTGVLAGNKMRKFQDRKTRF